MIKTCFLLSVFALNDALAQSLPPALRLPAYSGLHGNALSFTGNQGALATAKNISGRLYAERKFMLEDLSMYTAGAVLPTSSGNYGLLANYSGNVNCSTLQFGLAYGRHLGRVDAGVQFNYHGMQLGGYGSASAISFDAGLILHLTDRLRSGIQLQNPVRSNLGKLNADFVPAVYAAGLGYNVSDKVFIGAEMHKWNDNPIDINCLLHYQVVEQLSARFGISSGTSSFFFGAGLSFSHLQLDMIAGMHPQLGITPGLMLTFPK